MAVSARKLPQVKVGDLHLTAVAKETVAQVGDNDLPGLSAEMAYHSVLTLFPFLLFLAGMTAVLNQVFGIENFTDRLVDRMSEVLSGDATNVARSTIEQLQRSNGTGAALFGLLGSLWSGSAIMGSAMKGLNRIYDRKETRSMIPRKLIAVGLSIMFCGILLCATILVAAGEPIAGAIGDWLGFADTFKALVGVLVWPFGLSLVLLAVTLLYWLGPAGKNELRWVTIGAVIFGAGWALASAVFAFYVTNFNSYNDTYGSLGFGIIILVWLYWTNFLLLMGAQVNVIIEQIKDGPRNDIQPKSKTTQAQP